MASSGVCGWLLLADSGHEGNAVDGVPPAAGGMYDRGQELQQFIQAEAVLRLGLVQGLGTMTERLASCSCGKLTVRTQGEPTRISICHCLACQQRTGSVFGAQARFPADAVTIEGQSTEFARTGDEGTTARFHFCPQCGSTVFYLMDAVPGAVAIPVGAFADPDFPQPRVSVYEVRKHRWVGLPGDIEHLD